MPTIEDVDFLISYNGYAEDMRNYMSVNRTAWTCKELWFPYGANLLYGPKKKSRIQIICEHLDGFSSSYNQYDRVDKLIEFGAKPDIEDTDGMTPLMICALYGWEEHIYMTRWLISECGADVNRKNKQGYTALHLACTNNLSCIVKELLDYGADVNSKCDDGVTRPIHWAADRGHLTVVKMLVENGAHLDSNVMDAAIRSGNAAIIKYLHKKGCPLPEHPIMLALENKNYNSIKCLVNSGADPNEQYEGRTVLDRYLNTGEAVLALCQAGANVNLLSNGAHLILKAINEEKRNFNILKILCKYGANLNVQDLDGLTPLHIVVDVMKPGDKDDLAIIKELLKNPIDFSIMDNFGETALEIAKSKCATEIICEIKKAMLRKKLK